MSLIMTKEVVMRKIPEAYENHVRVLKTVTRTYYYKVSWDDCNHVLQPQNIPVRVIESKPVTTWEF